MPEHADLADILLSLRGVWDEVDVDELDHALQSAARAMDDGADDELVLAAALHDIAHSPLMPAGPAHDQLAGRTWLTPRYGEAGGLAGGGPCGRGNAIWRRPFRATSSAPHPSSPCSIRAARRSTPPSPIIRGGRMRCGLRHL